MAGLLLSIIAVIFFALHAIEVPWQPPFASPFLLTASLAFLVIALGGTILVWQSIIRVQTKALACAQDLFIKDRWLPTCLSALFALCLYSLYLTLAQPEGVGIGAQVLFYLWIIAFGVGFDVLRFFLKRLFQYTYTPFLVDRLAVDLEKAVHNEEETKAFEWLEVAIDSCAKATQASQIRMASSSLNAVQTLIEIYVKEVSRADLTRALPSALTFLDKVNFLCIFVAERLLWVYETALKERALPIADSIIAEFGKMSVFFARHNARVAAIPLSFLVKCAESAQTASQDEVLTRIALTLSETTKSLLAYTKERNESFRDLVLAAINTLEQIVKTIYKKNREINVVLLMQPFAEVGEFIGSDQMRSFPDRDDVLREIRRILNEFQALQVVTRNLESIIPVVGEDTTSSYQEDLPYTTTK